MGILTDAISIVCGVLLGAAFKERVLFKNFFVLGISIMIISFAGFFENMFSVVNAQLESGNLMIVVFSLIIGSYLGEKIHIDERLSKFSKYENASYNALIDTILFFGIGGLQISGPILLAIKGDNSQLMLKSLIDFPFALMFGVSYGKIAALSAVPVASVQILIALSAHFAGNIVSDAIIKQLCAMGYIVLFFSGFNLICESKYKINNTNMLPGIFIIIIFNLISSVQKLI